MAKNTQSTNGETKVVTAQEIGALVSGASALFGIDAAFEAAFKSNKGATLVVKEGKPAVGDVEAVEPVTVVIDSVESLKAGLAGVKELRGAFADGVLAAAEAAIETEAYETLSEKLEDLRHEVEKHLATMHEFVSEAVKPFALDDFVIWSPDGVEVKSTGGRGTGKKSRTAVKWNLKEYTFEVGGKSYTIRKAGDAWTVYDSAGRGLYATEGRTPSSAVQDLLESLNMSRQVSVPRLVKAAEQEANV